MLDSSYLSAEAGRLAAIASGAFPNSFSYPDLLDWTPPRTQLDAVGLDEDRPVLAGLGGCSQSKTHSQQRAERRGGRPSRPVQSSDSSSVSSSGVFE